VGVVIRPNLLEEGKVELSGSESDTPELDAQLLLAHALGVSRMTLLTDPPDMITDRNNPSAFFFRGARQANRLPT